MKLNDFKITHHELKGNYDRFQQNVGVRNLKSPGIGKPKNKLINVLGHGVYSTAIEQQGKEHVYKISSGTGTLDNDPYYLYVKKIANNPEIRQNPFIPRIFRVKVYKTTDKNYPYFYIVKMEKLFALSQLSEQELIDQILAIAKPKITNTVKAAFGLYNSQDVLKKQSKAQLIDILVHKVRTQKIKNQQLQAAMNLAADTGMEFDITDSNIMVRKTSNGPQLVLADPVRN